MMFWGHRNGTSFSSSSLARTQFTVKDIIDGVIGESDVTLFKDEISKLIRRMQVLKLDLRFLEHSHNLLKILIEVEGVINTT